MRNQPTDTLNPRFFPRTWDHLCQWIGCVPLGVKILGIVLAAMAPPISILLWAIFSNHKVSVSTSITQWLIGILAAVVVGLVISHLLTDVLTHPIREIARVARLVDQGNLEQRVIVQANDEIGDLGEAFNTMIDNLAESYTALHNMNNHLTERNEELSMVCALANIPANSLIAEDVVSVGLKRVLGITGFDAGVITLVTEVETLTIRAHINIPESLLNDAIFLTLLDQLVMQAGAESQPQWLNISNLMDSYLPTNPWDQWGYDGLINVPVTMHGAIRGTLTIFHRNSLPTSFAVLPLLAACKQLSITLENALLYEELRRKDAIRSRLLASAVAAQEQERERISRELHDETGQALTALLVQMKVFERLPDLESVVAHASEMRELVVQTLEEVRRLARDLRPSTLDNLGLEPTLEWYIKACQQKCDIEINHQFMLPPNTRLPRDTELILYRVTQEALTNILRHAEATRVWIQLEQVGEVVRLSIEDNGCGFNVETTLNAQERNLGLLGIQERVGLVGGRLHLESAPGQGTCLQVEVAVI